MYLVQQNGLKVQQADPNRLEPSWNLISSMILAKEHQIIKKKNMQPRHLGGFPSTNRAKYQGCLFVLLQLGILPAMLYIRSPIVLRSYASIEI